MHVPSIAGLPFIKMNGLGNDFVILDARRGPIPLDPADIRAMADRKSGIGFDQLIVLEHDESADVFMRILNADGSEADACGNATRCVADLMMTEMASERAVIRTAANILEATRGDALGSISVDMGRPLLRWSEIPLAVAQDDTRMVAIDMAEIDPSLPSAFSAVSMGNPHAIFFVNEAAAHDLGRIGLMLEHHALFPERANISLVTVVSRTHLTQRVWERGAGLTLACGTGACAAAVAAIRAGLADHQVTVSLPGGDLSIDWRADGHVIMTGPVSRDFEGVVPELGRAAADRPAESHADVSTVGA